MADYPFDLTGRVAIVTGGGTGIGAATAALFAKFGADVVIASRKLEKLQAIAAEIKARSGRRILPVQTDVRLEGDCAALIERTIAEFGALDILVNNAGGAYMFPLDQIAPERWDNTYALNVRSAFLTMHFAAPHLKRSQHASVVNISSAAALQGATGAAAYASAKYALHMLTRVAAGEWGPQGVRVNCIAVGPVASEGAVRSWARFGASPESFGKTVPLRRAGQPEDVAWGIFFFASDMSSWVTGDLMEVAGGPTMPQTVAID